MNSSTEFKMITELDLDPIKVKVMHKESGEGWSRAQVDAVEFEYRRFLSLIKLFPHEHLAPLYDVDIFWHYHILDTMKYAADCEQIFGYFLHHFPYSGLLGEDDEEVHHRTGARMQELYEATFGEAYIRQEHAVMSWSVQEPQTAWSNPTIGNAATSQGPKAKTAWSNPTIGNAATLQGPVANTAWSNPTIGSTDWLQAAKAKADWRNLLQGATARLQAVPQNNTFYSMPEAA